MKMLNSVLEADVFATSRIPIPSPPCMRMGEDALRCDAPLLEPRTQVHHHHAEAVPVAVAVVVDDAREKKKI